MRNTESIFLKDSNIAFDRKHRAVLRHNISKYDESVDRGKKHYANFSEARSYASHIKNIALEKLPELLRQFETSITTRGASVLWARNSNEALQHVNQILTENQARLVVKSKSMVTEEIGFNEFAEHIGIENIETDLGEFIVQVAGEKPYHILTPAMHKSKEDVAELFHNKFGTPEGATPELIAGFVRRRLREKFITAQVGVTGANFLVADIGGVGLTENEGNGLMSVSYPQVHIVIAGIERVLPSVKQLPFFFQWLAVHGTGQHISAYNTLLLGPRTTTENDGSEKMYVILLDNGRSELMAARESSRALKCIRCGACLNACPIYKNVGGYTYASTYTGPIGSVITPFFKGFSDYGHLSFACTVCGRCTEVCPVKIPLHELLLLNRKNKVENESGPAIWNLGMKAYGFAFKKRSRLDFLTGNQKNILGKLASGALGNMKQMPHFSSTSFSNYWKSLNQ